MLVPLETVKPGLDGMLRSVINKRLRPGNTSVVSPMWVALCFSGS